MSDKPKKRKAKRGSTRSKSVIVQPLVVPSDAIQKKYSFLKDFFAFRWNNVPLRHAYGVYSLCVLASFPDYLEIAADSLTEGFDDKDVDLCLIDSKSGTAYIAQCYASETWDSKSAPTNKADDLLTGLSWLLHQQLAEVPESLRKKAKELQDGLEGGGSHILATIVHPQLPFIRKCKIIPEDSCKFGENADWPTRCVGECSRTFS